MHSNGNVGQFDHNLLGYEAGVLVVIVLVTYFTESASMQINNAECQEFHNLSLFSFCTFTRNIIIVAKG